MLLNREPFFSSFPCSLSIGMEEVVRSAVPLILYSRVEIAKLANVAMVIGISA